MRNERNKTKAIRKINVSRAELLKALNNPSLVWLTITKISKGKYYLVGINQQRERKSYAWRTE